MHTLIVKFQVDHAMLVLHLAACWDQGSFLAYQSCGRWVGAFASGFVPYQTVLGPCA